MSESEQHDGEEQRVEMNAHWSRTATVTVFESDCLHEAPLTRLVHVHVRHPMQGL